MPDLDASPQVVQGGRVLVRESLREIVVVALGILAAFWIDASWDGRQERIETERLLSAVTEELNLNAAVLERAAGQYGARAQAGLEILNLTGPEADSLAATAAVRAITSFWQTPQPGLSASALTAALESGRISSISDVDLREGLGELAREYSEQDRLGGEISRVMTEHIFPRLWSRVPQMNIEIESGFGGSALQQEFRDAVPDNSRFSADLRGLLRDLAFENAVVERTALLMIARNRSSRLAADLRTYAAGLDAWDGR